MSKKYVKSEKFNNFCGLKGYSPKENFNALLRQFLGIFYSKKKIKIQKMPGKFVTGHPNELKRVIGHKDCQI